MADSSSLYGSTPPSGSVSSSNYTTLYSGGNNFVPSGDNVIISGTLTVNGCSILTDCSTFNLLPFNATTINFGGSSTAMSIGGATGVTTIQNQLATGNYLFPLADGTAGQVLVTDGAGILSFAAASTIGKTYSINASSTTGGANFNLVSSDPSTDTIKFAEGTGISIVRTDADTITISNTGLITGVSSITGTANQVIASASTGAVTLSLPQDIATTSSVAFGGLNVDSGTLFVDPTNNRVGVNTNAPLQELTVNAAGDGYCQIGMENTERTWLVTNNDGDDLISYSVVIPSPFSVNNRLQFNATTGNQWFNQGSLGVNTNAPTATLDVNGDGRFVSGLTAASTFQLNGATSGYTLFNQSATGPNIGYTLPTSQGAAATVLTNDGSGNLSWALPGGGGSTFGNITIAVATDNTISTTTGNLVLASATNEINASTANITANSFTIDSRSTIETTTLTTTSVSPVSIVDTGRGVMKCVIHVVDNVTTDTQVLEALIMKKATAAYMTTYAEIYTGVAALATFTTDVSAGTLRLIATPASTNSTTFTVVRTSLD